MELEWVTIKSKKYLKFKFNGFLDEQEALDGIGQWKKEFDENSNSKISLVWDCSSMKGYSHEARSHWQRATKELKSQIEKIWLISDSILIRTGAEIISVFARIKIKAVKSEDKIG